MMSQELSVKVLYAAFKKMIFERLGTIKRDAFEQVAKELSEDEKLQFAEEVIAMTEKACADFIVEMRRRLEAERVKTKK